MARSIKFTKLIPHLIYLSVMSYFISRFPRKHYTYRNITRFRHDMKHILLWTDVPGFDEEGQNVFLKRKCAIKNCYASRNRTLFGDLRYFDAVLFDAKDVSQGDMELPSVRSGYQKYIFVANDSSDNYPVCKSVYDDFFNWTWTYKLDSTIPYQNFAVKNLNDEHLGTYFPLKTKAMELDRLSKSRYHSKSKAAAIFLDKCDSRSEREKFILELQKELAKYKLSIDVFGKCGKECKRKSMAPCFWKLRKNYFFYLALEDSIAEDYITEQILYGYKYNAVPIVYGGANYPNFLPQNSYINAMEMDVEYLAKTMNSLIQNRSGYYEYFEWKNHYVITDYTGLDPCNLCRNLNHDPWITLKVSFYMFRAWWNPDYRKRCDTAICFVKVGMNPHAACELAENTPFQV
ncbi:alpha-(1,3)-fucosyltransferase C-like [Plodia interpunctella]|uniref:alpha-(1,3)-fucosyltransferase C-like n=1 Tax=Plodia interpunctella TaxID=58824 RepID=UPI0023676E69|nr:alpha-(1,3)-fucosyltransferase C-like [Plodia interpunctella]